MLLEELDEHHSLSPEITGGDLDASWQTANQAGEETVGGSSPTPDQDNVEQLGQAAGLVYRNGEPLDYDAKVLDRDRNRWELNPASALDQEEESPEEEEDLEDEDLDELDELDELEDEEDEDLEEEDLEEEDDDELDDEDLEELGFEIEEEEDEEK